jgi:Na+-transporting methylmalonyl-CoA/oxaloacetate decarboxylase gamma subunit
MSDPREKDALLALISTLSVVFVVLFFSLVYFVNLKGTVAREEARVNAEIAQMRAEQRNTGAVAGYTTDEPQQVPHEEYSSEEYPAQ